MRKLSLLLVPTLLFSGCVTAKKYQQRDAEALAQSERAETLNGQLKTAAAERDALKKSVDDLNGQLKASADQLAGLQKSNADLKDSLDANKTTLSQKVSSLIKERDALQQKADAADAKASDLAKQLTASQTANKALEDAKAAELAQVKKSYEDMTAGLKSEIANGQVQITQLKGKLTVNMVDQILFDSGHADVKGDGEKVLGKVGEALNKIADKDVRIEGHTDNKPITGALQAKFPSNWELSTARATAVARYLVDHAGVDPKRLVAAGYGEFKPKASNEAPEGRAQNRRIEIVLVPRE